MGKINNGNGKDITEAEETKRWQKIHRRTIQKKILMTQKTMKM